MNIAFASQRFRGQLAGDTRQAVQRTIRRIAGNRRGDPVGFLPVVFVALGRQEIVVDGYLGTSRIGGLQEQEGVRRLRNVESLHDGTSLHRQCLLVVPVRGTGYQAHGSIQDQGSFGGLA